MFVIDQYTIIDEDILVVALRNKKDTRIQAYKLPSISDLNSSDIDHLVILPEEAIGSYDVTGRITMMKDSLLSTDRLYFVAETSDRNENMLTCLYLEEYLTESEDIQIKFQKMFETKFNNEIMDF